MGTITKDYFMNVLNTQSLAGFTLPIKWTLARYVVAFTDNVQINSDIDYIASELYIQYSNHAMVWRFSNINIGGRVDFKTQKYYIDFSTSTDSLDVAYALWKARGQKAIWDNVNKQEIRI